LGIIDEKVIKMKSSISATVKTDIRASVEKVWDALTKPEIIKQYFFGTQTSTTWEKGTPITFDGEWQGKSYHDKGTILDIQKNKLIRYNYWSSMSGIEDKPENYVIVSYELDGNENNVALTITQQNIPDEKTKEHSEANWRKVLADLKKLVETNVATYS
jgi:uncharacterized protein YndB with AHSA1/START domain